MMKISIFALLLLIKHILADDYGYDTQTIVTYRNGISSSGGYQIIQYKIAAPLNFQNASPIFYGIGGRETVEDIEQHYSFFRNQYSDLDPNKKITPIIVFVEQRFFGKSKGFGRFIKVTDFAELALYNVIVDHQVLIRKLAKDYNTKTFLFFGAGHGGLIAGYLVDKIQKLDEFKKYNFLAWISSPPLKYLRIEDDEPKTGLQEINKKLAKLLKEIGNCSDDDIGNFKKLFDGIKELRNDDAGKEFVKKLNLIPMPRLSDTEVHDDLKQVALFIRRKMIDLTFNKYNNLCALKADGTPLSKDDCRLSQLCYAIKEINGTLTPEQVNFVLFQFGRYSDVKIYNWRLTGSDHITYSTIAPIYYQDCSEYQLAYCPKDDIDPTDPFTGSQWNTSLPCNTIEEYKEVIATECRGLFGDKFNPEEYRLPKFTYPRSLKSHIITTINKQSIYGDSFSQFSADNDKNKYAVTWEQSGIDSWEFQNPKICDSDKVRDIRYLILRAFGCIGKFIDNHENVCDTSTLFDDRIFRNGKPQEYDDTLKNVRCSNDLTKKTGEFPFNHTKVNIINPEYHPVEISTSTLKTTTILTKLTTSPSKISSTTDGASSLFPMTFILFNSLFVGLIAGFLF